MDFKQRSSHMPIKIVPDAKTLASKTTTKNIVSTALSYFVVLLLFNMNKILIWIARGFNFTLPLWNVCIIKTPICQLPAAPYVEVAYLFIYLFILARRAWLPRLLRPFDPEYCSALRPGPSCPWKGRQRRSSEKSEDEDEWKGLEGGRWGWAGGGGGKSPPQLQQEIWIFILGNRLGSRCRTNERERFISVGLVKSKTSDSWSCTERPQPGCI